MALLVNSHYPMPWIVWKRTHSITIEQYGYANDVKLAHGLPFVPLLLGQWSDNASFAPSYDLSVQYPGGRTGGQPETYCNISADATNVYFTIVNNANQRTFYFRLMAFAPPDYDGEVTPVEYNSPFRFNSHYRYQQLYLKGRTNGTVSHNLGYLPQAKVWTISGGRTAPFGGILTTSTLKSIAEDYPYYYHIYKDRLDG